MDQELKEKWVKALRSGKFKQGRRSLKKNMADGSCEYCCLGVLMQLQFGGFPAHPDPYKPIAALIGDDAPGRLGKPISNLIEMNDDQKRPFSEIADYIERNL